MKIKLNRLQTMAAAVGSALAAFLLRLNQLSRAFDDAGMTTGKGVVFFSLVTVLAVAAFAFYSFTLKGRKKYKTIMGQGLTELVLGAAAAFLMITAGGMLLLDQTLQGDKLVAVGSILVGACWGITAAGRYLGKKVHCLLFMIPAAFYVVELVCRFRLWTRDPIIIDYCYELFALISIMCAVFHLGGFCFEQGSRRMTVFFSLCGVFFGAAALAKNTTAAALGYGAAILWLLANLWLLLRPSRRKQEAEPLQEAEPETEEPVEAETEEVSENSGENEDNEENGEIL